ncbi:MAG: alpha/beta hydrolase [Thermoanaerobaculia bacterium]
MWLTALWVAAACAPAGDERLELVPCADQGPQAELQCGRLPVPENPSLPDGRWIDLRVVVAPALEPMEGAAALFVLEGGPGIPASHMAEFLVTAGNPYGQSRDVVMVDLRGTGGSHPLYCPELEGRGVPPADHLEEMYPLHKVEACREQLEARADLTQYTTARAVEDLEAVRRALGYERIDLQGISYGSRLALEYIRRHPSRVRSLLAIGSLPPSHRMPLYHASSFQRAFDLLLKDCEGDAECHEAYPRLREQWLELLERLERSPARHLYTSGGDSPVVELEIRRNVFVEKLRSTFYFASAARALPRVIVAAAEGDFGPFVELALPEHPDAPPFLSEGAYLSITCTEDLPRIGADEVASHTRGTYLGDYRVARQRHACEAWAKGDVPEDFDQPVASSVPALLVTGERDPVTPPSEAEKVAAALENARVVIVPHAGHLPWDASNVGCVDRILLDFLERASADGLDLGCLQELEPAPFGLPGAS